MQKPKMMPGQTPYTDEELVALYKTVEGAAIDDPGEQEEPKHANLVNNAFAEPEASNLIDTINPNTGKSSVYAETLEQIRERYPTAEIVNIDEWCKAKAAKQDEPVQWLDTTEDRYHEMLNVLPPAAWISDYFLVGEAWDHHAASGRPRYSAYGWNRLTDRYVMSSRPMTIKEFKEFLA